jgi:hypothetical protein
MGPDPTLVEGRQPTYGAVGKQGHQGEKMKTEVPRSLLTPRSKSTGNEQLATAIRGEPSQSNPIEMQTNMDVPESAMSLRGIASNRGIS